VPCSSDSSPGSEPQAARRRRRPAALLLAVLALVPAAGAGRSAGGPPPVTLSMQPKALVPLPVVAQRLKDRVAGVQRRFEDRRRELPTKVGPGGELLYPQERVTALIDQTSGDLDASIREISDSSLDALRDWAKARFGRIRRQVEEALE